MKVFVVDGSPMIRRGLVEMLESIPYASFVGEAADAAEAIRGIRASAPDVILLDINLRASQGIAVLQHVARESPATKVIVLTNHVEPGLRKRYTDAGAYLFLDKTMEFEKVRDALAVLDGKH
jgi:DNA-binding NarL/FixJ family response regulator